MKLILGSIIIVATSQLIGRFIPPFSIFFGTTILIPCAVSFINFSDKPILGVVIRGDLPVTLRIALVYLCVIISFTLDFLYSPGTKDSEGDAIVLLSSFTGLIAAGILLVRYITSHNKSNTVNIVHIIIIVTIPSTWIILNRFGHGNILYAIFG
jgi:hypothetical protein